MENSDSDAVGGADQRDANAVGGADQGNTDVTGEYNLTASSRTESLQCRRNRRVGFSERSMMIL